MSLVVTALSQDGNIAELKTALTQAGFSVGPLQLIGPDDSAGSVSRGIAGADILISDGGAKIPGINTGGGTRQFFRNESLADRLGDLEIPDSEVDNYVEALERGRSVIAYFATAQTVDRIEELFRAANLTNVRRF